MRSVIVDNYIIDTPIIDILRRIQISVTNGKLRDIKYSDGNDHITVTCPVHNGGRENKPATGIYIGDNADIPMGFYNCFVCGSKGPFYKFVAECFDWSEDRAKEWLKVNYGKQISAKTLLGGPIKLNKNQKMVCVDTKDFDSYQSWCPYLAQRGISRATCAKFNVKYDPENRQVVFPCYNKYGKLVMFAKRSIDSKIFHMDKGIEKPVYGLNYVIEGNIKKFFIVEGPIDALVCWSNGVPAVALLGTPTLAQIESIDNSCAGSSIYIATDNDEAGNKFAEFIHKNLKKVLWTRVKLPPSCKDPADLNKEQWTFIKSKYSF